MADIDFNHYKMVVETNTGNDIVKAEAVLPYDVSQFIDVCMSKMVIALEEELAEEDRSIDDVDFYAYIVNEQLGVMWVLQFPKELNDDELTS